MHRESGLSEVLKMPFCSDCGKKISEKARFCPRCGQAVNQAEQETDESLLMPEGPEVIREFSLDDVSDSAYKLLEPGTVFQGYQVVRMLNKEPEGIKYIAEKDGIRYVLKLFFKYEFSNIDSILTLQTRLKRLNNLETTNAARVVEVNQNHDPAYMVTEYVGGESLANMKSNHPERLTEAFVRDIARQLVMAASEVRKQGLTLHLLTLSGIMVQESGSIVILSSGIKYEEVDEREEVFNLGVLIAQMLSGNTLYRVIYSTDRLKEQKFTYLPGVSISFNKVLADCLHRNVLQRYNSLDSLAKNLKSLVPLEKDEIFSYSGSAPISMGIPEPEIPKPKAQIEWPFFLIIGLVVLGLVLVSTIWLPKFLRSSGLGEEIADFFSPADETDENLAQNQPQLEEQRDSERTLPKQVAPDEPRRSRSSDSYNSSTPQAPVKLRTPIPSNFVYISPGSLGFNRSKENPNDNVSLDGFYICINELTQAEWNKYMMPASVSHVGDNLPVDNISWMRIIHYCNARSEAEGLEPAYKIQGSTAKYVTCNLSANGYRLPTEAEWEMVGKAGRFSTYSGADSPDDVAWFRDNSGGRYRIGKSKSPNGFGVYDMTGNVAEWCWDWYDSKYPNNLTTFINPTGPDSGNLKVIRGGSVRNGEGTNLQLLFRDKGDPTRGYQYVGFRLVRKH